MNTDPVAQITPTMKLRMDRAAHMAVMQMEQAGEIMAQCGVPLSQQDVLLGALVQTLAINALTVATAEK